MVPLRGKRCPSPTTSFITLWLQGKFLTKAMGEKRRIFDCLTKMIQAVRVCLKFPKWTSLPRYPNTSSVQTLPSATDAACYQAVCPSLLHQGQPDDSLELLFLPPPPEVRLLLLPGRDLHGDAQLLVIGAGGWLLLGGGGAEAGRGAGLVLRCPEEHGWNSFSVCEKVLFSCALDKILCFTVGKPEIK